LEPVPRFSGQVALVTGGASGIGQACIERLLREGARAVAWDVNPQALASRRAAWGEQALCQQVDVTDGAQVAAAMAAAVAHFGRLDIVINSAGIVGPAGPFWTNELTQWQRVIDLNLTAVFLVSQAAVPHLMRSGAGRIVNLASIAGKEGNRHQAAYSASKAGVIGLTKTMAKDLVEHGVLVHAVAPAAIQSELLLQMPPEQLALVLSKIPMGRPGKVEEVAAMVCWLASPECSFSTGAVFDLSGGRATY